MSTIAALALLGLTSLPTLGDADRDNDGLSDFQEIHKYFTDPDKADPDGDGIPDGDWNERREYTYSVRSIIQVLPPVNLGALNDDYQDARVLEVRDDCVEIEVIHYPFNTNAAAIDADPDWRRPRADLADWLKPGPTSNWDAELAQRIRADLAQDGIDVDALTDRDVVTRASTWLMKRARSEDSFTTCTVEFIDGRPRVVPALEPRMSEQLKRSGRTLEEQWDRELYGKGMYEHRIHGTCGSTAIYLSTALRAIGIPTRSIVCVPVIDASDPSEIELVKKRITHHRVRQTILDAAESAASSWTSHTFNEVFVGMRWSRLNYSVLGQNTLDRDCLGLMTHVNTFRDHAEAGLVAWGLRTVRDRKSDVFGGSNPYSCISLSDQFGVHAHIENPPVDLGWRELTITKLYWYGSPEMSREIELRPDGAETPGHVLMHVDEVRADEDSRQYRRFYTDVGKKFVLRAKGQADVHAEAALGYWVDAKAGLSDFYLRIDPKEFARMIPNVAYALLAPESGDARWKVAPGLTITRPR